MSSRRTALITGASSGIGEAFATVFASEGFDLVITARREARLRALAARLEHTYGRRVEVISCDLADPNGPAMLCAAIDDRGIAIDALVNDAGFGAVGTYTRSSWAVHQAMLHVMVMGPAELTYRLLPGMIERGYGRIINVASFAGLVAAPAGTLYGAAKSFLINFSQSLAREVAGHGIHVTAICPGLTRSEFHDVPATRATVAHLPQWLWMDASTVAVQGFQAVMDGTPVYVNGRINRALVTLFRIVPLPLVTAAGRRFLRLYKSRSALASS